MKTIKKIKMAIVKFSFTVLFLIFKVLFVIIFIPFILLLFIGSKILKKEMPVLFSDGLH